ncbi:7-cyano-7-deazaguanine synthase [Desulfosarcina alkanivorans]|uniref:7-cyano-7-deazaguanine synthase n=1 Tax=Desulfosarcina alkanivorans TaxID=571177 RepID=A0A5K7YED5_9BACT|nr:7-cyano-7-deazaguanine synthase QueC [Desulfosarcina alkanivorans]BBO66805.1 7-cyano-7-deazaguanine synthase [Desulfosarcina alkanivorans]
MNPNKKAVVLSSGGLDSTTVLAMARNRGYTLYSLSFFYGQRHDFELQAAEKVAAAMGVKRHLVSRVDLKPIGGSALTDDIAVPKSRAEADMADAIPVTYVPARNTIFLSYALAWAEVLEAWDIFIGVNAVDYSGYPDCRPEYIRAFETMANLATKTAVEGKGRFHIHAPLIEMTKAQIIRAGTDLGVDYGMTHSCYDPTAEGLACARCDSCILRKNGFAAAGVPDPTPYAAP